MLQQLHFVINSVQICTKTWFCTTFRFKSGTSGTTWYKPKNPLFMRVYDTLKHYSNICLYRGFFQKWYRIIIQKLNFYANRTFYEHQWKRRNLRRFFFMKRESYSLPFVPCADKRRLLSKALDCHRLLNREDGNSSLSLSGH